MVRDDILVMGYGDSREEAVKNRAPVAHFSLSIGLPCGRS